MLHARKPFLAPPGILHQEVREVLDAMARIGPRKCLLRPFVRGDGHVLRAISVRVRPDLPTAPMRFEHWAVEFVLLESNTAVNLRNPGRARAFPGGMIGCRGRAPDSVLVELDGSHAEPVVAEAGADPDAEQRLDVGETVADEKPDGKLSLVFHLLINPIIDVRGRH